MTPRPADSPPRPGPLVWLGKTLLHVALPALVLFGAWLGAQHLLATAPQTARKPKPRTARPVEVESVALAREAPTLEAMGIVRPSREVTIRAQVAGRVESVADRFEPGARFAEDAELLQVEKADYDLALAQARASRDQATTAHAMARIQVDVARAEVLQKRTAIAQAEANLRLEEGNQAIARQELEMLDRGRAGANEDLALRAPQLEIAKAAVDAARAGLQASEAGVEAARSGVASAAATEEVAEVRVRQAELDLERTTLRAPFNAWIRDRYVETGAVLGPTTNVATLIGTDTYWVEVTLPVSDLPWLRIPVETGEGGASVVIRDEAAWGVGATRTGRLLRLLGDLETDGRLARLLVEVEDPLHLKANPGERRPLLAGSYVRVEVGGRAAEDVVSLQSAWLRHGDVVWVADREDKLRIRPVKVRWRGRTHLLISEGLESGDRVVTTDLGTPVEGMPLRVRGAEGERGE